MKPLAFTWPYALLFWGVFIWTYIPEYKIVNNARKPASIAGSKDAGSYKVIVFGGGAFSFVAFFIAWVDVLRIQPALRVPALFLGIAFVIAGSLLRRHCWKVLGDSFTGDVRASADQKVITTGAYSYVRHPSYTGALLMNLGLGLGLSSWASTILLVIGALIVYSYRMSVEEQALASAIGEPYREFMRTRRRVIPFIY